MFLSLMSLWGINPQRRRVTMKREKLEEEVRNARKELIRLSPLRKKAAQELEAVSKEIDFWAGMKYEAEKKLVDVQIITPKEQIAKRKVKIKKEPTFVEIISSLNTISSFDRDRLIEALKF